MYQLQVTISAARKPLPILGFAFRAVHSERESTTRSYFRTLSKIARPHSALYPFVFNCLQNHSKAAS
jgi:hypothetical protein